MRATRWAAAFISVVTALGGWWLYPAADEEIAYRQTGTASWYGAELEGRPTASGEPFDPDRLTAAHRRLPLGSTVTVTNVENGEKVTVEINDRGPFTDKRVIDLSEAAAERIGIVDAGVAQVRLEATEEQLTAGG